MNTPRKESTITLDAEVVQDEIIIGGTPDFFNQAT